MRVDHKQIDIESSGDCVETIKMANRDLLKKLVVLVSIEFFSLKMESAVLANDRLRNALNSGTGPQRFSVILDQQSQDALRT